ncbi:MAG: porin family protein [Muribaculaceae bacterium]|nr:porin family protein [Muribaculaceae bacterium]MDE6794474.1 porin family protein [Muribaculaceae bacterium]
MKAYLLAILLSLSALWASAQEDYRFDAGGGLGMTGYLGDANTSNLWTTPSWDLELLLRYIANPRWAFKSNIYIGALSGNSAKMTNVFPDDRTYKFSTTFYELGELAEFNFFSYGMGESYRKLKRLSPYITAGLGVTAWSVGGNFGAALNIPVGFGVKYKPSRRLNLGLEFLMKKTFTDRLDGSALDDPTGIKSSFMKNTDWYSTLTFTVSYEFSKRCAVCNYKD